jgi:3',5'-nucleoside bisphosphate phosphatase
VSYYRLVDLHTHSNQSDGSLAPAELVRAASAAGLEGFALTDHDTLSGFDLAAPVAREAGIDLVCGVELSTHSSHNGRNGHTIHLLAYFFGSGAPLERFRQWLDSIAVHRRDRNRRLAARLQELGLAVTLEEAEGYGGAHTGRPHFARVLMDKGHAVSFRDAFDRYIGENAPGYVQRSEPRIGAAIAEVTACGGVPVLAHGIRIGARDANEERRIVGELVEAGLGGLEVFHTDHTPADVERLGGYAQRWGLAVTGGSDFHGEAKPEAVLGGAGISREMLQELRARFG